MTQNTVLNHLMTKIILFNKFSTVRHNLFPSLLLLLSPSCSFTFSFSVEFLVQEEN